jgi:hypothetical protein
LLANEGITDDIRAAFVVYLLSHKRPMAEVLAARPKDIATDYHNNFVGMTVEHVALDDLLTTRTNLVAAIVGGMPAAHRQLLIGFEKGKPARTCQGRPAPSRTVAAAKPRFADKEQARRPRRQARVCIRPIHHPSAAHTAAGEKCTDTEALPQAQMNFSPTANNLIESGESWRVTQLAGCSQ